MGNPWGSIKSSLKAFRAQGILEERIRNCEERLEKLTYLYQSTKYATAEKNQHYLVKLHFVNMMGEGNVGDYVCGPYWYFSNFFSDCTCYFHKLQKIDFDQMSNGDWVIVGGGGLINHEESWNELIYRCQHITGHVILWGVGENTHFGEKCQPFDYGKVLLSGIRDKKETYYKSEFVPCASCMLPQLKYVYKIRREIGVIEHDSYPITEFGYEKINNSRDINTVLQFIGESETIISNSYHAIYWATLMKKKVIIYDQWSSKFDHLPYKQPIYTGNLSQDLENALVYENSLQECRNINLQFAGKIRKIMDDEIQKMTG